MKIVDFPENSWFILYKLCVNLVPSDRMKNTGITKLEVGKYPLMLFEYDFVS